MIVTKHFNILLFPKCGTHYIASVFEKVQGDIQKATQFPVLLNIDHLPASKLPYGFNQNPTGIVVRNAWDWYVSRYFYLEHARINGTGGFSPEEKNEGRRFIAKNWTKYCGFGKTISGFRKHLPYALENFPLGESFFSFIADAPQIYFLRHEELKADLHNFISVFSRESLAAYTYAQEANSKQHPVNITPDRFSVVDCYTDKHISQVLKTDIKYISRFGQEFNTKSSKVAIYTSLY